MSDHDTPRIAASYNGGVRRSHAFDIPLRRRGMLPKTIELVHGPGCPVCVLPRAASMMREHRRASEVIFTTFATYARARLQVSCFKPSRRADVRMVYSPWTRSRWHESIATARSCFLD